MSSSAYADWKAPKEDAAVLVWPRPDAIAAAVSGNAALLSKSETPICGIPLADVRQAVRAFLGHATNTPLFVTGHQAELHHPGVWIKNVVIDAFAGRFNGRAMHIAVDTDSPKHLQLRYPLDRAGARAAAAEPITDDLSLTAADWSGLVAAPTPAHITALERRFGQDAASFGFDPVAGGFLSSLRRLSLEATDLPRATTAALHELDWSLGLRYDAVLASPLWLSKEFALFCCHLIAHADQYAGSYNAALAEYRQREGIRTPGRPMPDLDRGPDPDRGPNLELPFWFDDLDQGVRTRGSVTQVNGRWGLTINNDRFEPGPAEGWDAAHRLQLYCRRHNVRLAPRALTLTTFLRLFLADLFIHGIGGGRYDQVTDLTFQSFFQVTPPGFAVATATLFHPWAAGRTRACLPCVRQQGHQLAHRIVPKHNYLAAIASAPRHSHERKAAFLAMHNELATAQATSVELRQWEQRLTQASADAAADTALFDRELFYALQPCQRLTTLIERVKTELVD